MSRPVKILVITLTIALFAVAGLLAWRLKPTREKLFTDGETIRRPVAQATTRDILWQPPIKLDPLINTTGDDYEPRTSADGLTMFFVRGKAGRNADIYTARKTYEGWTEPEPLSAVNSEYEDLGPEPSADGTLLYFYSDRRGGLGGYDLWVSRMGPHGWEAPTNLGGLVNSEHNDYGPAITADGKTLYFSSNRPRPDDAATPRPDAWPATIREDLFHHDYDLYVANVTDAGVGKARSLTLLNTEHNEGAPAVSPVGDFLYFASDRPGGQGGFDLYRSRNLRGVFQEPSNLGIGVNTSANELDPGLGMGGFGLYFSTDRPIERIDPDRPNDYDLYYTASREVFTEVEIHRASAIDWAAFWSFVGPSLLWLLLTLLLVALALFLMGNLRHRKLSLLARCLLASLFAHLILLFLFSLWGVTAGIADALRKGRGVQVALISPARGDEISSQIRGTLTSVAAPTAPPVVFERAATQPIRIEPIRAAATLRVERRLEEDRLDPSLEPIVHDAQTERPIELPPPRAPEKPATRDATLDVSLPDESRPVDAEEVQTADAATNVEARLERPRSKVAKPTAIISMTEVRLPHASIRDSAAAADTRILVDMQTVPDAAARLPAAIQFADVVSDQLPPPRLDQSSLDLPTLEVAATSTNRESVLRVEAVTAPASRAEALDFAHVALPTRPVVELDPGTNQRTEGSAVDAPSLAAVSSDRVVDATPARSAVATPTAQALSPSAPQATEFALPGVESAASTSDSETVPRPITQAMASVRASVFTARRDALAAHAMLADVAPARRATGAEPSESLSEDTISPRDALLSTRTRDLRPSAESRTYSAIPLWDTPLRMPVDVHQPETPYEQRSVAQRRKMVEDRGGDRETERAVAAALNWLARHQHADGRWDSVEFDEECGACGGQGAVDVNIATTGLALLGFLAADNTHVDPGQYREVVRKGLDFLLSRQADDGGLIGGETMYSHGIATIALAEAYGMTGDEALAWPVKQATDFIYRARNTHVGGWRYEPREDGDTSVLGWQIMALRSAERAGIEVSPESYAMARRWLEKVSRPKHRGLYAYQPGKRPTPAMTAEGMFTQQLLGHRPTESRMRESAEFVSANLPDWDKGPNTYYWYYGTLAMFQHGGHQWRRWNTAVVDSLLEHQRDDGEADGSWDPDGQWASIGGRVYQTAICALTLEVYYRYLPQFMIDGVQEEVGTIRGVVTDAWTGGPLDGATIRLDLPDQPPATTTSDSEGNYVLFAPRVPDFFALSAAQDGYVPGAANVSAENLDDGSVTVDFTLQPEHSDVVAIEASPDVHHLGNDRFEGSVNSQFQKESEGDRFLAEFELTAEQLAPGYAEAEIRMLTKGVQCPHEIRINGTEIDATLDRSPRDGSFGEYTGSFDANLLHPGTNTIEFRAISCSGDLDDFEFINIRIGLGH